MANVMRWGLEYAIRTYRNSGNAVDLSACGVGADATVWNTASPTAANLFGTGNMGVALSKYGIPTLNHPVFDPGQEVVNQRKAIGQSYRRAGDGFEYNQGSRRPQTSFEFDVSYKNIVPFLWLLFQGGMTEGAGATYIKTFIPYAETTADIVVAAALLAKTSTTVAQSHLMGGCIVDSLTLEMTEGMPLKCTASLTGYNMITNFDFDAGANLIECDSTAPLLMQNLSVELATQAINIPKCTITIKNNATPHFYDSWHVTKYSLGDFTVDGSITIPWSDANAGANTQINNFVAGTDALLQFWWGTETPTTAGDFIIEVNARYTGAQITGDNELVTELPFEGAYDGTNNSCRIYAVDGINRLV